MFLGFLKKPTFKSNLTSMFWKNENNKYLNRWFSNLPSSWACARVWWRRTTYCAGFPRTSLGACPHVSCLHGHDLFEDVVPLMCSVVRRGGWRRDGNILLFLSLSLSRLRGGTRNVLNGTWNLNFAKCKAKIEQPTTEKLKISFFLKVFCDWLLLSALHFTPTWGCTSKSRLVNVLTSVVQSTRRNNKETYLHVSDLAGATAR